MTRLRPAAAYGTLTSDVDDSQTTITETAFEDLPEVSSPDIMVLLLGGSEGVPPEAVHITAHAASSDTVTVLRGQETSDGHSIAVAHDTGASWRCGPTPEDWRERSLTLANPSLYGLLDPSTAAASWEFFADAVGVSDIAKAEISDRIDAALTAGGEDPITDQYDANNNISMLLAAAFWAASTDALTMGSAPFPSGSWYVDGHRTGGSRAVAAGYLTFFPITTVDPVTIDALAVMVKTGHASGAGHLYLVSSDPATGRPSTSSTVLAYAANVGATSSTTRVAAALNTAVTKTAGTVWAAWHCIAGPPTLLAVDPSLPWGPPITAPTVYTTNGYTGVYASGGGTSTTPLTNLSGLTFQSDINQAPVIQWRAA